MENSLSTYEPHGCVIVYSVVQRSSFRQAEEMVKYLWRENITKEKAVILVGNKADLARSRVITTAEGKALAKSIEAKFIETSSGIQHNVDELLVGILKQVSNEKKIIYTILRILITFCVNVWFWFWVFVLYHRTFLWKRMKVVNDIAGVGLLWMPVGCVMCNLYMKRVNERLLSIFIDL